MASLVVKLCLLSLLLFAISTTTHSRTLISTTTSSTLDSTITTTTTRTSPPAYKYVCEAANFNLRGLDVKDYQFCNASLPYPVRVKDLVDRMTLAEKALQLGNTALGVPRLGLPPYEWWSEALHGVSNTGPGTRFDDDLLPGATSFPTPILTAASFNESLWKNIGQVVSTEARAMFNLGLGGLTYWSPNINIVRDPRWGRALETPGEDPFTVGKYAVNYVRGLQDVEGYVAGGEEDDPDSRPLKVSSCCKHYAAYDLDLWLQVDRFHFDARVSEQDMVETFLRPFEMCVKEGDVSSVMCSFNKINGVPACADNRLLSEKIRGEWDLHGYIVADCDSLDVIINYNHWIGDEPTDAVSQALEAGLDLDCGTYYTNITAAAVDSGRIKEEEVDKALKNLYTVLMRLGFFDGSPGDYDKLGKEDVCSDGHIELAAQAAREGIVLLDNDGGALPLDPKTLKRIALVGPHANATDAMIGNYAGIPCRVVSPLDAFSQIVPTVDHRPGCGDVLCSNATLIRAAAEAARDADATIIFAGLSLTVEREWLDRRDLLLPGFQRRLIEEVAASSAGPVVLVILSGGPVDVSFFRGNSKISAIVWAGYPGEEGGRAIADVIFGNYNPGGRLPMTWYYNEYVDQLPMTSMQLRADDEMGYPGRTYKFFNGSVIYPFGHGLSYSTFGYETNASLTDNVHFNIQLGPLQHCISMDDDDYKKNGSVSGSGSACPGMRVNDLSCEEYALDLEVEVRNRGEMEGEHVVMLYSVAPEKAEDAPAKQLVAFQRVYVPAGGSAAAQFVLNVCKSFSVVMKSGYVALPAGEHKILIGGDGKESISFPVNIDFI